MAEMSGIPELARQLRELAKKHDKRVDCAVGYTQAYALWVHENMNARHKTGNAKFLENPFRRLASALLGIVKDGLRTGLTMAQALLRAGLRLQRESQLECPVDTGALKASAFTRLEKV